MRSMNLFKTCLPSDISKLLKHRLDEYEVLVNQDRVQSGHIHCVGSGYESAKSYGFQQDQLDPVKDGIQ